MKEKYKLFLMAFIGSLAGGIVRVETAAGAYNISKSLLLLALFSASFMLGRAIAAVQAGKVFDRNFSVARKIMIFSFAMMGLLTVVYLFVSVETYIILRLIFGILSGLSWPMLQSVLLSITPSATRGRDMSIYFIFGSLGMSTAYFLFGFSTMVISVALGAALYILTAMLGLISPRVPQTKKDSKKPKEKAGGRIRMGLVIIAVELGFVSAILATDTITGLLLLKGFSRIEISIILSSATYISIPISLAASYGLATISDKWGEKVVLTGLTALMVFSAVMFIYTTEIVSIVASIILLRMFVRSFRPILLGLAKSTSYIGSNIGAINASHNIFTTLLSPVVGIFIEAGMISGFTALTLGIALMALIQIRRLP